MAEQDANSDEQTEEVGLTSRLGPLEIDWPKTIGYYGGIGLALAAELIEPPFALFIAAIPVFKALSHPMFPRPVRIAGQVLEGAAQPVGGSDEATVHLAKDNQSGMKRPRSSIWREARALVDYRHTGQGTRTVSH